MKKNNFIEQSRRDNTHEVQLTPYKAEGRSVGMIPTTKAEGRSVGMIPSTKAEGRSVGMIPTTKAEDRSVGMIPSTKAEGCSVRMVTIILLALSLLAISCNKPEKKELAGTWQWTSTTGGIGGWCYTPESEGFEAEIVFKGSQFTFYKDGKKVVSGSYRIDYDVDETYYTNKDEKDGPFYSRFYIRFHLTEAQCKKMSEATNGTISLCAYKSLATLGYSEADGEVLSICDNMADGFCTSFVKK